MIVSVAGAQIFVRRFGAGRPVICLHAGVCDGRMFEGLAAAMPGYELIAYDRRGFGQTVSDDVAYANVADLAGVLDALGLATADLLGCSQGGRIAIDFSQSFPQRVGKIILIGTAVTNPPDVAVPDAIEAVHRQLENAEAAGDIKAVNALEAQLWLDGPLAPVGRVHGAVRDLFLDMNGIALRGPARDQMIWSAPGWLAIEEVTHPVLLLHGPLDYPHIVARHKMLFARLPDAVAHEIANTAHLPSMERPTVVAGLVRDFLT